jgi:YlmC/YmxH family sporulation protein
LLLSSLVAKEIVNLHDGRKLGLTGVYDLIFDVDTGQLQTLVVERRGLLGMRSGEELKIPWSAIKRIGEDVIILDQPLDQLG